MKTHTVLSGFFLTCVTLAACAAPGQGKEAESGKRRGGEIIEALSDYRTINGHYPSSLRELGDRFAPEANGAGKGKLRFIYTRHDEQRYTLFFKYFGPGSNLCAHESVDLTSEWKCSGAY